MGFWSSMGGAVVGGVISGVTSELGGLLKKTNKHLESELHLPKEGKNDPEGPSTHISEAQSEKVANSSVSEEVGLHRNANLTDLASTLGNGNHGGLTNGTLGQMSNPTNLTLLNATAGLGFRPRSVRLTAELESELNGRAGIGEQNPVSFFIFGIGAILLVAILALAALRSRRQKQNFELVAAIDVEHARDITGAIV